MGVVNGSRSGEERQELLFATGGGAEGPFAGVVFNRPVEQVFTYRIPPHLRQAIRPGQRVTVPLGKTNAPTVGYCVEVNESDELQIDPRRIKDVVGVVDDPPLIDAGMLALTRWMADYYLCAWGQALDAAVPAGVKNASGSRVWTCLVVPEELKGKIHDFPLSDKQLRVIDVLLRASEPLTVADVCKRAKCASGTIMGMRKKGYVRAVKRRIHSELDFDAGFSAEETDGLAPPALTSEQAVALDALAPSLRGEAGYATFLLHGVTGSGKTEVYLSAIEQVVAQGREAIVLVPEISLTPQTIRRFRRRFDRVAVLHSHLTDAERHRHWRSIASGEAQVVVGARSAVFAPTRKLGLIVIDEEHESTFKQETTPRYHARDVAVIRARQLGIPLILGSATPSLETWRNAETGKFRRLTLENRVGGRDLPEVALIDLSTEKMPKGFIGLSHTLQEAMRSALEDDGQVILLLNRRGYHTFAICTNSECRQVLKCDACDIALTWHKERHRLVCHTCDLEKPKPPACPACHHQTLIYGGIGTERLEREARDAFPDRVIRRMDSDTMRGHGSHERTLAEFRAGKIDILLGTQMIAKGLDFPNVTLVGVVNADTALHLPDFRASERTFQLVAQVAGRTGRGERPGKVLVQTYSPDVEAIACARDHDYVGFVASELPSRQMGGYPPFGRIIRLVARGENADETRRYLELLGDALRATAVAGIRISGPAPAPIEKIMNHHRFHIQLRCPTAKPLHDLLRRVLPDLNPPTSVDLAIDVDAISML
jgi:primosomal protein N' (replication factor Y)